VDIQSLLGSDAESLLTHESKGIPKDDLTLPGPDFVDRVFATSDRTPQVLRSLQSLYDHGRLGGTGYTSMAYLRRLPVDELKVDRSFVMRLDEDERDAAITHSIIDLGRRLGLNVVAEGVQTESAWTRLAEWGCHEVQGHLIGRPMTIAELEPWLRAVAARPARQTGLPVWPVV